MTDKELKAALKELPGAAGVLTIRKSAEGEYRVSIQAAALISFGFAASYKAAGERNESLAAYCNDREEALANAKSLLAWFYAGGN